MDHTVCPGSKFMRQPSPEIFECPNCSGEVEIWSDELSGRCSACGTTVMRDGTMSCLEWCTMARDCVGDEVLDSFRERKAVTIKEQLKEAVEKAASEDDISVKSVDRAIHFAEMLARSENADVHVVMSATALRYMYADNQEKRRSLLLRMGFQIADVDAVCKICDSPEGGLGNTSINERVVYDAHRLARLEELVDSGFTADAADGMGDLKKTLQTKTGADIAGKVRV